MKLASPAIFSAFLAISAASAIGETHVYDADNANTLVFVGKYDEGLPPCSLCHARSGEGSAAFAFGNLTGLSAAYMKKQLQDFQAGRRDDLTMQRIARALSEQDVDDLAVYYATLETAGSGGRTVPDVEWTGQTLAELGDAERDLPACVACHVREASDDDVEIPNIYGQHARYIENQLLSWKDGSRKNDPGSVMAEISRKLDDTEIRAISVYFAFHSRD